MAVCSEEIARSIDIIDWGCIKAHLERGGIIVIDGTLELIDVACKIANDEAKTIEYLIETGKIAKPSQEQIKLWDKHPDKLFKIVITSPFVVIQEQL